MAKPKLLLLNPPGNKRFIRDYYCSFSAKVGYCWPPQDLVLMSGTFAREFDIDYRDLFRFTSRCAPRKIFAGMSGAHYAAVVFATGTATLARDMVFIKELKRVFTGARFVASGAFLKFSATRCMELYPEIDACVWDVDGTDVVSFLRGDTETIRNMVFRERSGRIIARRNDLGKSLEIAMPLQELFLKGPYRMPLPVFGGEPFITTAASVGCGYGCAFCLAGGMSCRRRDAVQVIAEADHAVELGVRNIFFADCHFIGDRRWFSEFCGLASRRDIRWICNSRVEPLTDERITAELRKSGCRMVMVGVETGDSGLRARYRKGIGERDVAAAFANCRKNGVLTVAYLIAGLPGEDHGTMGRTLSMVRSLDADFISVSFAMPDHGTSLRSFGIEQGLCTDDLGGWDHSGTPVFVTGRHGAGELRSFRNRLYREFYGSPSRLLRTARLFMDACIGRGRASSKN